jgi:putative chitinase
MIKIKQFQLQNGLVGDGVLGIKTLLKIKEVLSIDTLENLAHFIGQCEHESGNFTVDTENLNYSAAGLQTTFKKYFTIPGIASTYARQPEMIANKVYANRMGNGNEKSGDGWKFKGRGAIQLTGKDNYKQFSTSIKIDCVVNPDLVANKYFFQSAKFFFDNNKLWSICTTVDKKTITAVSKKVNGGANGLSERIEKTLEIYEILKNNEK